VKTTTFAQIEIKMFFIRAIRVIRGFSLFAISVALIEKLVDPVFATCPKKLAQEKPLHCDRKRREWGGKNED
jgi:hypothetical protein